MSIKNKLNTNMEMPIIEHLEELRNRVFFCIIIFSIITMISFFEIKNITYLLQKPAYGIKFLQLAPGEYLFASIKVSIYTGFLLSLPFIIYQLMRFIIPGLTDQEKRYLIPLLIGSILLFFTGIIFSYIILIPAALNFLINYGSDIVEPIWSLEEYFNFILLLLLSTGIIFQVPVIQIILGIFNIFSSNQMLKSWKYIIFISTIIGAIITPSTDPITQVFMSFAIILLYFSGCIVLKSLNK